MSMDTNASMLGALPLLQPDPLWGLTDLFKRDERADKIDLIVGVYRDEGGETPVLSCVAEAERRLAAQAASKSYRQLSGNAAFNAGMAKLLLGADAGRLGRQYTIQTVGGTGALRLLADFIARANPSATVWSSDPGYINHRPIMQAAGLKVASYRWHETGDALDIDAMLADLAGARPGDIVIVHGCCHNPTGIVMPDDAWTVLTALCDKRGLIPLVDLAYQGFGAGLHADAAGLRRMVDALGTVLVAASCSKNMGLYCERTGAAMVIGPDAASLRPVPATLERITRSNYSMPPDHGAAIATMLFEAPGPWMVELEAMRRRVALLRERLSDELLRLDASSSLQALRRQQGMFSLLPLEADRMRRLRDDFAIYGTENGRINIAGLRDGQIVPLARALAVLAPRNAS